MKKYIHINQHVIKRNNKQTYKNNQYAYEVSVTGPCKVVYRPDKPLSCGAKVWIETESEVILS